MNDTIIEKQNAELSTQNTDDSNNDGRIDINSFQKQMAAIINENNKFADLKRMYSSYSDKLKKLADSISEIEKEMLKISKELNPFVKYKLNTKTGIKQNRGVTGQQKETLFNMMKSGTYITTELLDATYPNISHNKKMYLLKSLASLPNVKKGHRQNSRAIHLFI